MITRPMPYRHHVDRRPQAGWLPRVERYGWVWCVARDEPAQVIWPWAPDLAASPGTGRIGLKMCRWDEDRLNYLQEESWFADADGVSPASRSQVLLPIAGYVEPAADEPIEVRDPRSGRVIELE